MVAAGEVVVLPSSEQGSDSLPKRIRPRPVIPVICINSYNDLVDVLGTNEVAATAVILQNGIVIQLDQDLRSITYTAVPDQDANSLFRSKFAVDWRLPGGNWQLNTNDVWSLGCVFTEAGIPPFTNLLKGIRVIQINTSFIWETGIYTGVKIAYVVIP